MSITPSFRLPFTLPDDVHPAVAQAMRYCFNGLVDVNQAIKALKSQQTTTAATTTTTSTAAASSGGGSTTPTTIGDVNQQAGTSYTTQESDFGALIVVQGTTPFALTLNSGLTAPYYTIVFNLGTGVITMTPSAGNVNNVANLPLDPSQFAIIYFDGTNWWVAFYILPQSITKVTSQWLDSYDATTGLFTQSQPAATDINGTGLQVFANNAAAITGGLVAGNLYRTSSDPSTVCVVF